MNDLPEDLIQRLWCECKWDELIPLTRSQANAAALAKDPVKEAEALSSLSHLHRLNGRHRDSVRFSHQALHLQRKVGIPSEIAWGLSSLAVVLKEAGNSRGALLRFQQALAIFRQMEDGDSIFVHLGYIGEILQEEGRLEEAARAIEESLLDGNCSPDYPWLDKILENLSEVHRLLGNLPAAIQYQFESVQLCYRRGAEYGNGLLRLAKLHLLSGEVWKARELMQVSEVAFRKDGDQLKADSVAENFRNLDPRSKEKRQRLSGSKCKRTEC